MVRSGLALRITLMTAWFSFTFVVDGSSLSEAVWLDCLKLTVTSGSSSSVIETVVLSLAPGFTPGGRSPKVSFTLSSSSSMVSGVVVKVKVFSVSVGAKVTSAGTP